MTTTTDTMRVWVGCLACYNDGRLVGSWVDAVDADTFTPCERAGHEEWWCFDHEGLPITGECSPQEATAWAEAIDGCMNEHGAPHAAVLAYVDNLHATGPDVLDEFEDAWEGSYESEREFGEDLADRCGYTSDIWRHDPNPLHSYIDWDAWTRDLFMGDYWSARNPEGGVYVFRSL